MKSRSRSHELIVITAKDAISPVRAIRQRFYFLSQPVAELIGDNRGAMYAKQSTARLHPSSSPRSAGNLELFQNLTCRVISGSFLHPTNKRANQPTDADQESWFVQGSAHEKIVLAGKQKQSN